jgi:hypothetical protein
VLKDGADVLKDRTQVSSRKNMMEAELGKEFEPRGIRRRQKKKYGRNFASLLLGIDSSLVA